MNTLTELTAAIERLTDGRIADTATAAADAIAIYKAAKAEIDRYKAVQARAKTILNDIMAETGQIKWQTDFGTAYVPAGGVSVRYNAKALDAAAAVDPDLAAKIEQFRTVSERAGSLTIK